MAHVNQSGTPVLLAASGAISLVAGDLIGYHVNSTTALTIVIRDGGASGTAVSGTITPSIGFQAFPGAFTGGCYATLGGTGSVTFFFAAG